MTAPNRRLPLPNFAALFALSGPFQKKFLGGIQVPAMSFLSQVLLLFWEGSILGYTQKNRITAITPALAGSEAFGMAFESTGLSHEQAIGRSFDESWIMEYLSRVANDGLAHYGGRPSSLLDLLATSFAPAESDFRTLDQIQQLRKRNFPAELACLHGSSLFVVGISLGLSQPDLARELSRNPYGDRGEDWFKEFRQAGGMGPPTPVESSSLPDGMPERLVRFWNRMLLNISRKFWLL